MPRPVKFGLAQIYSLSPVQASDAPARNLSRAVELIRDGAAAGAQVVVLPEFFLTTGKSSANRLRVAVGHPDLIASLAGLDDPAHHHHAQPAFDPTLPLAAALDSVAAQAEPALTTLCRLARELQVDIVAGTVIERVNKSRMDNVATYISRSGEILSRYRKRNLWWPERDYLVPGEDDDHVVFETEYGKVGMLVCWDLAWPEAFRSVSGSSRRRRPRSSAG